MPKLRQLEGGEFIRILRRYGFEVVRTKGQHHLVCDPDGRCTLVPAQAGEAIGPGLLARIMWDAELTHKDLL
jgi:predicted RNA binding protein YcfA (HicA-like mRNA interferase family)